MNDQTQTPAKRSTSGQSRSTVGLERIIGCVGHGGECCKTRDNEKLDAARYRFLRLAGFDDSVMKLLEATNAEPETPEQFDETIDIAMRSNAEFSDRAEK